MLFIFILFILSCNKQINLAELEPEKVRFVKKSPETAQQEKGIDAVSEGNGIKIEWYASRDETVTGYRVYRCREDVTSSFTGIRELELNDTTFVDNVEINTRYYYYLLALSDTDVESQPSDTLSYKLCEKATGLYVDYSSQPVKFLWEDPATPPHTNFLVRIREKRNGEYVWLHTIENNYQPGLKSVEYNVDGNASPDTLQQGREYEWRVDVLVKEEQNSGSESGWQSLIIQ